MKERRTPEPSEGQETPPEECDEEELRLKKERAKSRVVGKYKPSRHSR